MPIGKPVLRAESGLAHGANFDALDTYVNATSNGLFYHNLLWVQLDSAIRN